VRDAMKFESPDDILIYLKSFNDQQASLEKSRKKMLNSPAKKPWKDEQDIVLQGQIDAITNRKIDLLNRFAGFPPHHDRHQKFIEEFHKTAPFEKSVFIMSKFPDPNKPDQRDAELTKVIKTVQDAVTRCRFTPRVAFDKDYYPGLWENVELYLLGSSRGIAIVEDCYKPELNPNVAMEWGWMRGMGRNVLFLVEEKFNKKRADWSGLIEYPFEWAEPAKAIPAAVHKWLSCQLKH
jgi:hypothetical protein